MPRKWASCPREVFLSHAYEDRAFVKRLAAGLREHGIRSWYSEAHILAAEQWHDVIGAALSRCDWFVVVLSPHSLKSKWVKRELLFALQEDRYTDRIVPLLLKKCKYGRLSWTLSSFQLVDFAPGFDEGCRTLLRRWGLKFRREAAVAASPHFARTS